MLGDKIRIQPEFLHTAQSLLGQITATGRCSPNKRQVIFISGESGSGKSVTAVGLSQVMESEGYRPVILHLDDYFRLPPRTNHNKRVEDISWVGPAEVRLDLLQQHVDAFRNGEGLIRKPLVDYPANAIHEEVLALDMYDTLILEGTYAFELTGADVYVFMDRDYKLTFEDRLKRGRDIQDAFVEQVLEIEHHIIRRYRDKANLIIQTDYRVTHHNPK